MFFFNDIKIRTILVIVSTVFIFNAYTLYGDITESVSAQKENLEKTSKLLAQSQAYAAREHYWSVDFDSIKNISDGFKSAPSFYRVSFYDENNTIIHELRNSNTETYPHIFTTEARITMTVNNQPFYLGYLIYEASYKNVNEYEKEAYIKGLKKLAILTLILSFALYILIEYVIVLPLKRISKTLSAIAEGDTSVEIPYQDKKDQIGQLASAATIFRTNTTQLIDFEKESRESAEKANEMKDLFLARMSHELRTPLHGISGYAQLLLDDLKNADNIKKVETMKHLSEGMEKLVQNILDFSKIKAGKFGINRRSENIYEIIQKITESIEPLMHKNENVLYTHIEHDLPEYLLLDAAAVEQILFNLLSNATKFTHNGSITLSIKTKETLDGEMLLFSVADTGVGMSEAFIQNGLFNLFTQEDEEVTRKYGGTGLGVSIVKELVKALDGSLTVKSEKGEGTIFSFTIPYNATEHTSTEKRSSKVVPFDEAKRKHSIHVLVVDDEPVNRDILKTLIQKQGYTVTTADDGEEAVAKVKKIDFDLILMDLMMPKKDGFTATTEIRSLGYKDVKIIAVSANTKSHIEDKCKTAGMDDFIPKPFSIDSVRKLLSDVSNEKDLKEKGKTSS